MRVIYCTIDNVNDNVILAQTLPFLGRLARLPGVEAVHLLALRKHGGEKFRAYLSGGIRVRLAENRGRFHPLTLLRVASLAWAAWRLVGGADVCIGRNPVSVLCLWPAARLRGARLVFDYRGILSEEYVLQGRIARRGAMHRLLRALEGWVLDHVDATVCVSHRLAARARRWRARRAVETAVVPCCCDARVARAAEVAVDSRRRELGLDPTRDFVLLYAGSLSAWNAPHEMLAVYWACRETEAATRFLVLTEDTDRAAVVLGAAPDVLVRAVPHADIGSYLAVGDLGLLIRSSSPVNRVASPVKFGEYLACGVPVLVSPGVGDCPAIVEREQAGFVLRDDRLLADIVAEIRRERAAFRARCRRVAAALFDAERYTAVYRGLLAGEVGSAPGRRRERAAHRAATRPPARPDGRED
jgi:glycosyltransferase involved in cell wall biosynthesis